VNRSFRDRDYLETADGLFFTVIGSVHPEDRVLAYRKKAAIAFGAATLVLLIAATTTKKEQEMPMQAS
jgi:hypothetical protein